MRIRIRVNPAPMADASNPWPLATPMHSHREVTQRGNPNSSTQLSGSLYIPTSTGTEDTLGTSTDTISTLNESMNQNTQPESSSDVFEYRDDNHQELPERATVMNAKPTGSTTLTKARSRPKSRSPKPMATRGMSSLNARPGKCRDDAGDADDDDGEYTPRKRTRRPAKSRAARRAQGPMTNKNSTSLISDYEHQGNAPPTRPNDRRQDEPVHIVASKVRAHPAAVEEDVRLEDLVEVGVNYLQRLDNTAHDSEDETPVENVRVVVPSPAQPIIEIQNEQPIRADSRVTQKPNIIYYIVAFRNSLLSQMHWLEGSLEGTTIESLFDEVSTFTGQMDIQRIVFTLSTSRTPVIFTIPHDNPRIYENMKKKFSAHINMDMARGNLDFEIELHPDPVEADMQVETSGANNFGGFSFG